ncbi:MAG: DUF4139 domain-containing protein [Roseicyclus sp.]
MRLLRAAALALCLPVPAYAEDILLRADIAQALVFARGAEVTREALLDLPAGRHSLLIPMRDLGDPSLLQVAGPEGLRISAPVALDAIPIPEGALDSEPEARARAALDRAVDAVRAARDALALRDADIAGIEAQLDYLAALAMGGADGAAMPADPAGVAQILETLGAETARLGRMLQDARIARREDEAALEARLRDREAAEIALEDLDAFGLQSRGIRLDIEAAAATTGALAITYLTPDAGWRPGYTLRLDTAAARLAVTREVTVFSESAATWRDVAMRVSTALPDRRRAPSEVTPDPVRIAEPPPEPAPFRADLAMSGLAPLAEAAPVEDAAALVVDGLSVLYDIAAPVSIGPTGQVTLPLDTATLDVSLENRAVPRRDATAFLVATGENASGAPLLPGRAQFFRDGDLVGSGTLPLVPAGGEMELGFGPLDHLRLFWRDLSLDEGDRGLFTNESAQRRRIVFGVENTSATPEAVRLLHAAPFAEQEDLELELSFVPAPDEMDVDDLRGVAAWDLTVPAGAETRIEMLLDLAWPEDMILTWEP